MLLIAIAVLLLLVVCVDSQLRGGLELLDPKTVTQKGKEGGPHDDSSQLRFLFFGTSRTYGALLSNPSKSAFPFLLSPSATNLAINAGSSLYPSHCAASMLEDTFGAYDVIVLEFEPTKRYYPDTMKLAVRLRQRFPNALIIFLEMWQAHNFENAGQPVSSWANQQANPEKLSIPALVKASTLSNQWEYGPSNHYSDEQVKEMHDSANGVMLKFPRPLDAHEAILSPLLLPDMNHPSEAGHQLIADTILKKMQEMNFRANHDDTLGSFDSIDQCKTWLQTGVTSITHDTNLVMTEFKRGKFALEAKNPHTWIKVFNENNKPVELTLEYMVTSPDCLYSDARISIDGGASVEVTCKKLDYTWEVHVAEQIHVGTVPPGVSIVRIDALEGGGQWPFRMIGILLMEDACENAAVISRLRCTSIPSANGNFIRQN